MVVCLFFVSFILFVYSFVRLHMLKRMNLIIQMLISLKYSLNSLLSYMLLMICFPYVFERYESEAILNLVLGGEIF